MTGATLMVVGSMSSVGKSLLTAALCRLLVREGLSVAPFKAQNMSNNAAVCPGGGEIGRAQALQAAACGLQPSVDFNPVLLKPEADSRSQVIVRGRPWRVLPARSYYEVRGALWAEVTGSLDRLRAAYDVVVIEGAGSAAELNLAAGDIVNMSVARYAGSPVLLVGDIDRGGIFAQLLGTLMLMPEADRALVRGLIVNRFRGDQALFADGVRILEERSGLPVLGVVPFLRGLNLPEEDAAALDDDRRAPTRPDAPSTTRVAVLALPRISNFDDVDALSAEPGVRVDFVRSADELGEPDAIVLPGTKSTVADLAWLRSTGLADGVRSFAERGGAVVGLCGGYQMMGRTIADPDHVESGEDRVAGLGLLPTDTVFDSAKTTNSVEAEITGGPGWMAGLAGAPAGGYEIHMGATRSETPWLRIGRRDGREVAVADGAVSPDGRVWGCYVHGLFDNERLRRGWLAGLGWRAPAAEVHPSPSRPSTGRSLDLLADAVGQELDMGLIRGLLAGAPAGAE